jgi:REP element-mobilizing transposase RayT
MARLARVVIPGLPHHVMQRGNGRQQTFRNVHHHHTGYINVRLRVAGACVNMEYVPHYDDVLHLVSLHDMHYS